MVVETTGGVSGLDEQILEPLRAGYEAMAYIPRHPAW
jgi:hypothetical protein